MKEKEVKYVAITRKYGCIWGMWDMKALGRRGIDPDNDYYEVDLDGGTIVKIDPRLIIER